MQGTKSRSEVRAFLEVPGFVGVRGEVSACFGIEFWIFCRASASLGGSRRPAGPRPRPMARGRPTSSRRSPGCESSGVVLASLPIRGALLGWPSLRTLEIHGQQKHFKRLRALLNMPAALLLFKTKPPWALGSLRGPRASSAPGQRRLPGPCKLLRSTIPRLGPRIWTSGAPKG